MLSDKHNKLNRKHLKFYKKINHHHIPENIIPILAISLLGLFCR